MIVGKFKIPNDLDLYKTLTCGQAFRWGLYENGNFKYAKLDKDGFIYGIVYGNFLGLKQEKNYLFYKSSSQMFYIPQLRTYLNINDFLNFYFKFDKDITELYKIMEKDEILKNALIHRGIRILRQEPFETAITFIFPDSCFNSCHIFENSNFTISSNDLILPSIALDNSIM